MSNDHQVMKYHLKQILKNLFANGISDVTTEVVTAKSNRGVLKLRFYTEEQWLSDPTLKATLAEKVMKVDFKGSKFPSTTVVYDNTEYLVQVINK